MHAMLPRRIYPRPPALRLFKTFPWLPGQTQASRQAVLSALSFLPQVYSQVTNYDNARSGAINGVPVQLGTILIPLPKPYSFFSNTVRVDHKVSNRGHFRLSIPD